MKDERCHDLHTCLLRLNHLHRYQQQTLFGQHNKSEAYIVHTETSQHIKSALDKT